MWKKNTDTLHVLEDKYAMRFVDELDHRCTAYKFFLGTATYSDTCAFWYKDFASREDAVQAAKNWLMRGELERGEAQPFSFAPDIPERAIYEPEIEKQGW